MKPSNSTLLRHAPAGQRLNATDSKPSLFHTPPPQIEVQGEIEEPSPEEDITLVTLSNGIEFVLISKGTLDFENPLTFNIAELENISLSSFLLAFAQRTDVKTQRVNGLIFIILLGDNRSEKVMEGEKRRWQKVVEIIGALRNYSQVQWRKNPRMKSKDCKIFTESIWRVEA